MILRIINEINIALDNNCPILALTSALTLPDICGKAEFPELSVSQRYKQWVGKYVVQPKDYYDRETGWGIPFLSGELLYALRCSMLHQGDPDLIDEDKQKQNIDYFELLWQEPERSCKTSFCQKSEIIKIDGKEKCIHNNYCIGIRGLCKRLCVVARRYYNKNKKRFDFLNDNTIVNIDFRTRQMFHLQ